MKANLSILIPCYHFSALQLVETLEKYCAGFFDWEILVFEDAGPEQFTKDNERINQLKNCLFKRLSKNVGRSAIRNQLAAAAAFDRLLFVDADSEPGHKNFIKDYLNAASKAKVLAGGTLYERKCPDPKVSLRWKYGREREQRIALTRSQTPYEKISLNNLFIEKEVFLSIRLDESIRQYGHEDTLFGLELEASNISVLHIDNPVYHLGLEPNEMYLQKALEAVETLFYLRKSGKIKTATSFEEKAISLKQFGLDGMLVALVSGFRNIIINQLNGKNPNLKLFDLLRLVRWIELSKK